MQKRFLSLSLAFAAHCGLTGLAATPVPSPNLDARTRIVFSHALPPLDPAHLQVTTVEVTYPPGGSSAPHSHPCPVIGYVLRGAVRMQVKGGEESVYKTGESFYEAPNGVHLVSANAGAREPAVFLAYFICDHSAPLSSKVPTGQAPGPTRP
jgi:quercetin dioxygenase-like cupin family protein